MQNLFILLHLITCLFSHHRPFIAFFGGLLYNFTAHAAPYLSLGNHHLLFTTSLSTSFHLFFLPRSHISVLLCMHKRTLTQPQTSTQTHTHSDVGPPASFKPSLHPSAYTHIGKPQTPLLCAVNGAARQILYFSGSSDRGRPVH